MKQSREHLFQDRIEKEFDRATESTDTIGRQQTLTKSSTYRISDSGLKANQTQVLILGRMSTGSTAISNLFSLRDEVFYVGEPGHLLFKSVYYKHVHIDSADYLQEMQAGLCEFLRDLYNCEFKSHDDFLEALNSRSLYRSRGSLRNLNYPITQAALGSFCQSKPYVVSKVLRLSDLNMCLPMLKDNKVKVIFLARDPRGTITSRLHRWGDILGRLDDPANANYYPTKDVVKEHCNWLDMVFNFLKNSSDWLIDNSMLIRFEDKCINPGVINQAVYKFVGMSAPPSRPASFKANNESATKWLNTYSYDRIKTIQDYCSGHIYKNYRWLLINDEKEFERAKTSWYRPTPQDEITLKYKIP
ncbi:carbohydrate sulfotransferase 1-like [Ptychodera flava]|uniref:carbohydrate sulfotransferase 1-like n=1 Tax=Ptychodera flava TaxID=63121 RepID=UPI00396A7452